MDGSGPDATLSDALADALGERPLAVEPVGGGDVADARRVTMPDGSLRFAKTRVGAPPDFFDTEARGLDWLRAAQACPVPEVIAVSADPPLLVLEWVEPRRGAASTSEHGEAAFGRALAALHRSGAPCYGRLDGRTTGSRGLPNDPCSTWSEFYATQRLEPVARLTADAGALPRSTVDALFDVAARLGEFGGDEAPARLHGDLWAGNRLIDVDGTSWLIDPAAHGGHREFDLAMMRLFGGFGAACFEAYQEVAPLADGWRRRIPLHQLAPLAVHALKFGGHYVRATQDALDALRSGGQDVRAGG